METIGKQELWSFLEGSQNATKAKSIEVRRDPGHQVKSFLELATKIAELHFRNRDHVLIYRGQPEDYRNKNKYTTLKPTLFRPKEKWIPNSSTLIQRFETLKKAEQDLVRHYENADFLGIEQLKRHRILRWAILQHYEVCRTPLLDVTASLRIAASFGSIAHNGQGFVFVLGVPNLSGAITASAEAGLQIVRLSSVCPPTAIRPHIQEGYLLGEYPEMSAFDQKEQYSHYEIDFGRRLVAKFCFDPKIFWKRDTFPIVKENDLYPSLNHDPLYKLALEIKNFLNNSQE